MKQLIPTFLAIIAGFLISINTANAQQSVAREWNEVVLEGIRNDFARPTVHARNLWHISVGMYDAWAAYDDRAETFLLGKTIDGYTCPFLGVPQPMDIEAAREEALSYATYRLIYNRFQNSPDGTATLALADNLFTTLGYDPLNTSTSYGTGSPAALGNFIALCIIDFGMQDDANQQINYVNTSYQPVNPPLVTDLPGNSSIIDPNRWQPLTLDLFIDQSGNPIPFNTPEFLSPEWGMVTPFALSTDDLTTYQRDGFDYLVYHDPGLPPYLDTVNIGGLSEEYKWGFSLVSIWSSHLDPTDGVMWDISPASIGNVQDYPTNIPDLQNFYNTLDGGDPGIGHAINPATGQAYAPQMVARGDYARVLAEFWADGPDSETPPGHWFTILNYVNDHPDFEKRYRGTGDILDPLEWDIKAYFALGGAMHDAAITAWGVKGWYDYLRPISAIRYMGELGQSSDSNLPRYHPGGLPLVPGYIELVEIGDPLAGAVNENLNKIKLYAWKGPNYINNPATDEAGVDWILAENWWPYQRPSFVTPPFAGYVSGHSTYSRAAAELMILLTGDEFFPGGMGEFPVTMNDFLVFEEGPSTSFTLQWATYRDASDQCSLSRIWGGIHPPADDIPGRLMGEKIGVDAFNYAETYFFRDDDMDGWFDYLDCDDNEPAANPAEMEVCDGIDNDCNGLIDDALPLNTYYMDSDNDNYGDVNIPIDTCLMIPPTGYVSNALDCDDTNNQVNPLGMEICDSADNNCDGQIDEGLPTTTYYIDTDNDGYGNINMPLDTCLSAAPAGYVANALDCDDDKVLINPDAVEICDGLDNDCNGQIDEGLTVTTYYPDTDNDGYGDAMSTDVLQDTCLLSPPLGYVANDFDCDDTNNAINPDAIEICDGIDNDCNGLIDDGLTITTYYLDNDGDSYGDANISLDSCAIIAPTGYVTNSLDCNDNDGNIHPAIAEICDAIDNDCNGLIDDGLPKNTYYLDSDGDNYGDLNFMVDTCISMPPTGYVINPYDCNDLDFNLNPDALEVCDDIDNNCNGFVDEGLPLNTYYFDNDQDGFGDINTAIEVCYSTPPLGYVTNDIDCDDSNAFIYPGAVEVSDNGIDEDCTGIDLYLETKIFPNPVQDVLFIRHAYEGAATLQIISVHGQLVRSTQLYFANNETVLNVNGLPKSLYFFRFIDSAGKQLFVERVMRY